jgi:cytochrome c oxidase subunit 2
LNGAPAGSYEIEVVAQQFAWNIRYPGKDMKFGKTDPQYMDDTTNPVGLADTDTNGKDDLVTPTLVIPVNRPVELVLKSKDVTHSFWVPQLRFKQDLVPGMAIHVHFTANKVGKYELACAELCGMNHYKMKSYMLVLPQSDFDALNQMPQAQFQDRKNQLLESYQLPQY